MFGYITTNPTELPKERNERYQAFYCGLCHTLWKRYGNLGRATLSYDMNDCYSSIVGSQAYLEAYYGLDGKSVADRVQAVLEGRA